MPFPSPRNRAEISRALEQQEGESRAYWQQFDTDSFFRNIGKSWSPAEAVRHLIKSTRPVVKALGIPKIVLRLRFGKARRESLSYDDLCSRYRKALAEGGRAGRFAPSTRTESDAEAWRQTIMTDYERVNHELRAQLERWSERDLDRLQLPHPLLGNLTVREMLFFTLYHQGHHVAVVERNPHGEERDA